MLLENIWKHRHIYTLAIRPFIYLKLIWKIAELRPNIFRLYMTQMVLVSQESLCYTTAFRTAILD